MYCEDFKGLSSMAKPSSWVPGNLSQVGEIQVTLVSETGAHSSPAWPPSYGFSALTSWVMGVQLWATMPDYSLSIEVTSQADKTPKAWQVEEVWCELMPKQVHPQRGNFPPLISRYPAAMAFRPWQCHYSKRSSQLLKGSRLWRNSCPTYYCLGWFAQNFLGFWTCLTFQLTPFSCPQCHVFFPLFIFR